MGEPRQSALAVAPHVARIVLKLFHPYMPFVTEELWQLFREQGVEDLAAIGGQDVVALADWPQRENFPVDAEADRAMAMCIALVRGACDARATSQIQPKVQLAAKTSLAIPLEESLFREAHHLALPGEINATDLRSSLRFKIAKLEKALGGAEARLGNASFAENASADSLTPRLSQQSIERR